MSFVEDKKSKDGKIVLCAELKCSKCGREDYKDFKPKGLLFADYIHESIKLVCPNCGIKFDDEPLFGVKHISMKTVTETGRLKTKAKTKTKTKTNQKKMNFPKNMFKNIRMAILLLNQF